MTDKLPKWTPSGRKQVIFMERQLERITAEQASRVALAESELEAAREMQTRWLAWATEQVRIAKKYEEDEIKEAKR